MIKYVNFMGKSFNNEDEYNESLKELLNQPLNKYDRHQLSAYIDEFFKEPFSTPWKCELVKIDLGNYVCNQRIKFYSSIGDKNGDCILQFSTKEITINGDILLKDFEKEIKKIFKGVLKNWKNILDNADKFLLQEIEEKLK